MKNQFIKEKDKNLFEEPEMQYLRNLDDGIKDILFEQNQAPEIKYKKYIDLLNKYNAVMKNVKQPFEIEVKNKQPVKAEGEISQKQDENIVTVAKKTINNKKYFGKLGKTIENFRERDRAKAREVMKALKKDRRIKWDAKGRIYFNNGRISGSDISESLADLMKVRKNTHPGFAEIVETLHRNDFPTQLIVNKQQYKRVTAGSKRIKNFNIQEILDTEHIDVSPKMQTGLGYFKGYKQLRW